jgi:DNA-binding transcriptional LysR family regulator
VSRMEERLGVRLFHRKRRGSPTGRLTVRPN